MTHTSTDQCTACYGSGTGENGFDCLRCAGDGWVFAEPARPAVAHTSTEQPEALRLAEICESKCLFHVADELRRLHARVQELAAERAAIIAEKDEYKVWLRAARAELEASKARVPIECVVPPQINQTLNRRMYATGWADCLRAHGITQEKQGCGNTR